jgi:large subunit ribosomal protein L21
MYAIVDIAGQQFKVEKDQKIFVHRQNGAEGSDLFFDKVLLIDNGKKVTVGTPVISDALVSARILTHLKGDKVKVFKKKRRKGYQILKGHRQLLTEIQISDIFEKGGSKARSEAVPSKQAAEKVSAKEPEKKPAAKTTGKTKSSTPKKAAADKKDTGTKTDKIKGKASPATKSPKTKAAKETPAKKAKK